MQRYFSPYWDWEDYKNGMYSGLLDEDAVFECVDLLSDDSRFYKVCLNVIENWRVSSAVNLTNTNCNRRAWLGQAACSFDINASEVTVRAAWKMLTHGDRNRANQIADKIIRIYEDRTIREELGTKGLF